MAKQNLYKIKTSFSAENHEHGIVVEAVSSEYVKNKQKVEMVGRTVSRIAITDEVAESKFFDGKKTSPQIMFAFLKSNKVDCFKTDVSVKLQENGNYKVVANDKDYSSYYVGTEQAIHSVCNQFTGLEQSKIKKVSEFATKYALQEEKLVGCVAVITDLN